MTSNCPSCGTPTEEGGAFCSKCGARVGISTAESGIPPPSVPGNPIWYQNFYRIRKKVVAITNQYWIENADGSILGYSKQKLIRIKEDIRVFADDSMSEELFRIRQDQVVDMWGTFGVIDSVTEAVVGKIRRQALRSGVHKDEYLLLNAHGQTVGKLAERSRRGLMRKYMPGGVLVPEQLVVEFQGRQVAEIKQQFKIIGDIWEVDCSRIPAQFDRRILLSAMLLMGMIERDRK
ncbi:MAG: zinc ribbon domain-containing protein [Methanobacteriota archaeon]|nr:MAG: zinc ribbon domain-containing protein [Euryarchaeota archaeon]